MKCNLESCYFHVEGECGSKHLTEECEKNNPGEKIQQLNWISDSTECEDYIDHENCLKNNHKDCRTNKKRCGEFCLKYI